MRVYGGVVSMGALLGWLVQKRWLTLTTFLVTLVGALALPRLPLPYSYSFVVLPAGLLAAMIYEGPATLGLRVDQQLRIAWALWMGLSALVLTVGIMISGSTAIGLVAGIAVFSVMITASVLFVGRAYRRALRQDHGKGPSGR